MELTLKDKLLLINQYRILSKLSPEDAEHYEESIEILTSGYRYLYGSLANWIDDEMPEEKSRFVMDVLSMYRAIHFSGKDLDGAITEQPMFTFSGFDGNEEGEYHSFTRFCILTQNKFAEQKPSEDQMGGFNSHSPMIPRYSELLSRWDAMGRPHQLTPEQISKIIGD